MARIARSACGAISFWFAVLVFFCWIASMTILTFRAVSIEERRRGGIRVNPRETAGMKLAVA